MVAEGYKNELDSGYSFKGEPTRLSDGLDVDCEK